MVRDNTGHMGQLSDDLLEFSRIGGTELARWINLLQNALKFSGDRDVSRIRVDFEEEPAHYLFRVQDNGAGFDMNYVDKLFGVFQSLHYQDEFPGTGVGLATVQRIIRRHGGEVWAEAEIDRGAAISFTLPRVGGLISDTLPSAVASVER